MRVSINFDEQDVQYIQKVDFEQMTIIDMQAEDVFFLCGSLEDGVVSTLFESECYVVKKDENTFQIQLIQMERRKFWDAPVGLEVYMNWKRNRIHEMQEEGILISEDSFDDDGDYVHLNYHIDIETKTGKEVVEELTRLIEINIDDTLQLKIDKLMDFGTKLDNRTII